MTTDTQAMREKMCELGRLFYNRKLANAACILIKSNNLSAFVPPEAFGLAARTALLKEEVTKYRKSNE